MKHYPADMRKWAAEHRTSGNVAAASDLECAADQMDKLIAENEHMKAELKRKENESAHSL